MGRKYHILGREESAKARASTFNKSLSIALPSLRDVLSYPWLRPPASQTHENIIKENELSLPLPQEENYKNMSSWPKASWETFMGLHMAALSAEPPNTTSNMHRHSFKKTGLRSQWSAVALSPVETLHCTMTLRQQFVLGRGKKEDFKASRRSERRKCSGSCEASDSSKFLAGCASIN